MAKAVGLALARLEPLIVEAGTGTGKTFAYLVPAPSRGAASSFRPARVHCKTNCFAAIAVPLLAQAQGQPVKIALLKGRANYLCRHRSNSRLSRVRCSRESAAPLACWRGFHAGLRPRRAAIYPNLPTCRSSPPCGRALPQRAKTVSGRSVPSSRAAMYSMRAAMPAADIVVVNHHLLLADLALKDEGFGDLAAGAEAVIRMKPIRCRISPRSSSVWPGSARKAQLLLRDISAELSAAATARRSSAKRY